MSAAESSDAGVASPSTPDADGVETVRAGDDSSRRPASTLLILISHYLPGCKVGGPVRSVEGLVDHLGDEIDMRVVCLDRDVGDDRAYPGVRVHHWTRVGKAQVLYVPGAWFTVRHLRSLFKELRPDRLYLNSLYSRRFTLVPLVAARLVHTAPTVVLAPRGGLRPGALRMRSRKKKVFLGTARALGLFRGVTWQASSAQEAAEITSTIGTTRTVVVAPNLAARRVALPPRTSPDKRPGQLHVIFLSRISRSKNLTTGLALLREVEGDINLTIAGPVEDPAYWAECRAEIDRLPPNVTSRYIGLVPHDGVASCLASHHLLLLPTWTENFGHVIAESLAAGTPVLISDRTPWRHLQSEGAGWDASLDDLDGFVHALRAAVALDSEGFTEMSERARALVERRLSDPAVVASNRLLFG